MGIKLVALGNVLMMDEGIAVALAKELERKLIESHIEVVYGETDVPYCISMVKEDDYIIILDASRLGKSPGTITKLSLDEYNTCHPSGFQHSFSFVDMLKIYYPKLKGFILAVEAADIKPWYDLSPILNEKKNEIAPKIMEEIRNETSFFNHVIAN